jgi:hypothetical protein
MECAHWRHGVVTRTPGALPLTRATCASARPVCDTPENSDALRCSLESAQPHGTLDSSLMSMLSPGSAPIHSVKQQGQQASSGGSTVARGNAGGHFSAPGAQRIEPPDCASGPRKSAASGAEAADEVCAAGKSTHAKHGERGHCHHTGRPGWRGWIDWTQRAGCDDPGCCCMWAVCSPCICCVVTGASIGYHIRSKRKHAQRRQEVLPSPNGASKVHKELLKLPPSSNEAPTAVAFPMRSDGATPCIGLRAGTEGPHAKD